MRRTKRTNDTGIERVYNRWLRLEIIGGIFTLFVFAGIALWAWGQYQAFEEKGRETDAKWEQVIKQKEKDMQKKYESFEESTNQDAQNTIDNIEGATEDTTGAEYYNEDPYTAPETQESVEQPSQETNEAPEPVPDESKTLHSTEPQAEKPKKTVESYDTTVDPKSQAEAPQGPGGPAVEYDEEGNPIPEEE